MRTIKINEVDVILYDSAEELPVRLFTRFQRYKIAEMGVGSSIADVTLHLQKLMEFSSQGMAEAVHGEVKNLFYSYHIILQEEDLASKTAYASL
jgi:hypothetical protein